MVRCNGSAPPRIGTRLRTELRALRYTCRPTDRALGRWPAGAPREGNQGPKRKATTARNGQARQLAPCWAALASSLSAPRAKARNRVHERPASNSKENESADKGFRATHSHRGGSDALDPALTFRWQPSKTIDAESERQETNPQEDPPVRFRFVVVPHRCRPVWSDRAGIRPARSHEGDAWRRPNEAGR